MNIYRSRGGEQCVQAFTKTAQNCRCAVAALKEGEGRFSAARSSLGTRPQRRRGTVQSTRVQCAQSPTFRRGNTIPHEPHASNGGNCARVLCSARPLVPQTGRYKVPLMPAALNRPQSPARQVLSNRTVHSAWCNRTRAPTRRPIRSTDDQRGLRPRIPQAMVGVQRYRGQRLPSAR